MDQKQPLQDQPGTPKSPNEVGADGKVPASTRFIERVHPAVLAAIFTGLFALTSAIISTYLPSRVRLDELRLAATMTAERLIARR